MPVDQSSQFQVELLCAEADLVSEAHPKMKKESVVRDWGKLLGSLCKAKKETADSSGMLSGSLLPFFSGVASL